MANILIMYWSSFISNFYNDFAKSAANIGNKVLLIDTYDYIDCSQNDGNFILRHDNKDIFLNKIHNFNPDVVLSFNNMLPIECVEQLDCPICLIDADSIDVGFWNKEWLKKNKDLFVFLGSSSSSKKAFDAGLDGEVKKYCYFPNATLGYTNDINKTRNIAFIGSNTLYLRHLMYNYDFTNERHLFNDILEISETHDIIKDNHFKRFQQKYATIKDEAYLRRIFNYFYYFTISGMNRVKLLSMFSDLGLELFGTDSWRELLYYDIELAKCFNEVKVSLLDEVMGVYNSSKISINISHEQAVDTFSWRVMDIMASSSCLLMEDKKDWHDLFGEYISDEVKEAIIYKDRYDARQKAIRLLEDEEFRLRCVKECNYAIEQNGRWEHRFKKLSEYLNINLFSENKGELEIIKPLNRSINTNTVSAPSSSPRLKYYQNMQYRNRWLGFINLFQLMLAQIPLVDLLFFKRKKRRELLEKINRYWR